jgi:hypothetical protein
MYNPINWGWGASTYLLRHLGLLALGGGLLHTNNLSLLYHAATSEEASQQQSIHVHTVDGAIVSKSGRKEVISYAVSIDVG